MSATVQTPKWKLTGPAQYFKTQEDIDKLCSGKCVPSKCSGKGSGEPSCINPQRIRILLSDKEYAGDKIKEAEKILKPLKVWLKKNKADKKNNPTNYAKRADPANVQIRLIKLYKQLKKYPPSKDDALLTWMTSQGIQVEGKSKKGWVKIKRAQDSLLKDKGFMYQFKF
tara:strand:- start:370 stop:876 length:507 start_codon:yes stop_codon:yes gene_type:complete